MTATEPRFAVPELVRLLAQEKRNVLAADFQSILADAKEMRKGISSNQRGPSRIVGAAISQASAQLAQGHVSLAVTTLQAAVQRQPKHPNLACMLARCFMKLEPARVNEARDLFKLAHEGGNKRPEVKDGWYQAECAAIDWPGALHVANIALMELPDDSEWRYRRAYAGSQIAVAREKSGDGLRSVLKIYEQAADDLSASINGSKGAIRRERVQAARALNDLLWARTNDDRHSGARDRFDVAQRGIKRGDFRGVMYDRLLDALDDHVKAQESIAADSSVDIGLRTMIRRAEDSLSSRPQFDSDTGFKRRFAERLKKVDEWYQGKLRQG